MPVRRTRRRVALAALAATCALGASGAVGALGTAASASPEATSGHAAVPADASGDAGRESATPYSFAVIGDVPYGDDQVALFPRWIAQINAAEPHLTVHVGDIKNGSTRCDDAYYRTIRAAFDRFTGPLVYTPGDNEWTDCHRENNGAYDPLERLAFDRSVFFTRPGRTLGQQSVRVDSQAAAGFPENVQLRRAGVQLAVVHVVGSNDGLAPWSGLGLTTPLAPQVREEAARMTNAVAVVRSSFARARAAGDRAVVVFLQADMFDPTYTPTPSDISAFTPLVRALVEESSSYAGQVYLVNGDSHVYNADRPLAAGSPWLTTYGVSGHADNLQRVTVDGSSNNVDWLRMTINPRRSAQPVTWERVPYTS